MKLPLIHTRYLSTTLLLVAMLLLSACASHPAHSPVPPPLLNHGDAKPVAEVDILEVSPEMDAFLERYVLKYSDMHTRLYLLMNSVNANGALGFDYDESMTLTSAEAFSKRTGNCIGFANMMVALARRAGLKAEFQEVFRRREWSTREDTVLLIKHINVLIYSPGYTYVVDVSGIKMDPNIRRRVIGDSYAEALYLNNIGAEALLDNDLPTAHAYMSRAIAIEPKITDPWVNLGVVFGRNDQLDDAEAAFNRALKIDATEYSAMSNLYEVYLAQEDFDAAENLQARVEKYRNNNPYYLMALSAEALEEDKYDESISLLKRAIKKKKDDHLLYFALAKSQYLSGRAAAAEDSMAMARQLAPNFLTGYYGRSLDQLVAEQ